MAEASYGIDAARELVARAGEAGITVATAESCTAGLIAARIADVPGASAVLNGGAVTYTEAIKERVLGVSAETLATHTAVSAPCAREMALGARRVFAADLAVSATGYAGPGGGTDEEPVGTVYLGLAAASGVRAVRCRFEGGRAAVRAQAAARALELLAAAADEFARTGVVSFSFLPAA